MYTDSILKIIFYKGCLKKEIISMFTIPSPDLIEKLSVHRSNGLSAQDVEQSRTKHGANTLSEGKRKTGIACVGPWLPVPLEFLRSRACAELSPLAMLLLSVGFFCLMRW